MHVSSEIQRFLEMTRADDDPLLAEMHRFAEENDFPIIGPDAGGVLRAIATMTAADRVFEFGSGFGYSAYWFSQGMGETGEIVLTEIHEDELAQARRFLSQAESSVDLVFEVGNAMEIVHDHDGRFDVVLIDHEKVKYAEAFEVIRDRLPRGGVVVADNMMHGAVRGEDVMAWLSGGSDLPSDENARGIATYLERVGDDPDFHTVVLPVGSGIAISTRS